MSALGELLFSGAILPAWAVATAAGGLAESVASADPLADRPWWLSWWLPFAYFGLGALGLGIGLRAPKPVQAWLLPTGLAVVFIGLWDGALVLSERQNLAVGRPIDTIVPRLSTAVDAFWSLQASGRMWSNVVASLFRVTWGYLLAAGIGIPLGLAMGWYARSFAALNPLIQGLRPISPLAWIPLAVLWFGIGDAPAIFLIFLAAFFPITTGAAAAVRGMSLVHQRSARNFGVHGFELFRRVVFPAALPQILTSLRLALGIAWLVIVAAEMVGMDSGLGYLIWDARNQGMRADIVVATMITIGLIGIALDLALRQLEKFDEVRWGFTKQ